MKLAKRLALVVALSGLFVASTGCYRHGYGRNVSPEMLPRYSAWHSYFLFGLVSTTPDLDLDGICPGGVARVQNFIGPIGGILSVVTFGLWTPTTVQVWCAAGAPPIAVDTKTGKVVQTSVAESQPD